jgi:hypothetical protein
MSDYTHIVPSSVILSAAKDLTIQAFPTLQKYADGDSGREVPHFVRDNRQLKTAQRAVHEDV